MIATPNHLRLAGAALALVALTLAACGSPEATPAAGNPLTSLTREASTLQGTVAEVHQVGAYTYLKLDDGPREAWLVVMNERHSQGETVEAHVFGSRRDFHSRALGRTFPQLHFGLIDGPAPR